MVVLLIIFYLVIAMTDLINLVDLRKLVYSFLLSKRNVKTAKKIHRSQKRKDRLTLSYIAEYTLYQKEFRFWQRCWVVYILLIIPQYLSIIITNVFNVLTAIILIGVLLILKIIFAVVLRNQFSSDRVSRFDKRY